MKPAPLEGVRGTTAGAYGARAVGAGGGVALLLALSGLWLAGCGVRPRAHLGGPAAGAVPAETRAAPAAATEVAAAASSEARPAVLVPGEPLDAELGGGRLHLYLVPMGRGEYARLWVDQRAGRVGVDVEVRLESPAGEPIESVDGPSGVREGEQLSFVSSAAGDHRIVVRAVDGSAAPGRYRVELEELRPAVASDDARVEIERLFARADHLAKLGTAAGRAEALALLARAVELCDPQALPVLRGDGFTRIGDVHFHAERREEAFASYHEALHLYETAGDAEGMVIVLTNLGLVEAGRNRLREALGYYQRALELPVLEADLLQQARTRDTTARVQIELGDLEDAHELLQVAIGALQPAGEGSERWFVEAGVRNSLARVQLRLGEVDAAEASIRRALDLSEKAGSRARKALCLNTLASLYRQRGELTAALATYRRILALLPAEDADRAKVLNNLGVVYLDLGQPEQARKEFERARALYAGSVEGRVETLRNLASAWELEGESERAVEHYREALDLGPGHAGTRATVLQGLGTSLIRLGRVDEAAERLTEAIALRIESGDRRGELRTRLELGRALRLAGRPAEARAELERAIELSRELAVGVGESEARYRLARLERDTGDLEAARRRIEEAIAIQERLRGGVAGDRFRTTFFEGSRLYYDLHIELLMQPTGGEPAPGLERRAFEASEKARARGLLDLLRGAQIDVVQGLPPRLKRRERRLRERIFATDARLSEQMASAAPDAARLEALQLELAALEGEQLALHEEIGARYPRYHREILAPVPLSADEVQQALGERQALLQYSLGENASFLFVVTRRRLSALPLRPAAEIRESVDRFRGAATSRDRRARRELAQSALELYRELVAPAAGAIGEADELLIAPDAALYYLPFEALITSMPATDRWEDYPFLLAERSITYVPSITVLAELHRNLEHRGDREGSPVEFVAFADPVLGGDGVPPPSPAETVAEARPERPRSGSPEDLDDLPPLPETRREVEALAARFGGERSTLFVGERATEANVVGNPDLATASWLHFATHGLIDERHPQLSGLVLSRAPGGEDDGVLRVSEIFNLRLGADLVVLSACRTGLGREVSGEGLVGLSRAFLYAGASSLVVSLWQVEDRSTAELMVAFKRHLDGGADLGEALRRAKLELIEGGIDAAPRLWAPFILIGERRRPEAAPL